MEVTEAGNPDDATSKTTHLKSTTVICIYFVMNVNYLLWTYDRGIIDLTILILDWFKQRYWWARYLHVVERKRW